MAADYNGDMLHITVLSTNEELLQYTITSHDVKQVLLAGCTLEDRLEKIGSQEYTFTIQGQIVAAIKPVEDQSQPGPSKTK